LKIAIVHLGNIADLIPVSSVIKNIKKKYDGINITLISEYNELYKYNKLIDRNLLFDEFKENNEYYDLLINLYPYFPEYQCKDITVKKAIGFNYDDGLKQFEDIFFDGKRKYDMNIFQLYYELVGLTWKGEGYDIGYYPRSKTRKNRIGISVANANLRNYILEKLELKDKKMWYIPYKKNVFKKLDEINRCEKIITDDLLIFHLAMNLRKYVYFLETFPINLKLELFNNGEIHKVSLANL